MKKNKLLKAILSTSILATAGIATTVSVHAIDPGSQSLQTPVSVQFEAPVFSVSLPIAYELDGNPGQGTNTTSAKVQNLSTGVIDVTDIQINMQNGWKEVAETTMTGDVPDIFADEKLVSIRFNSIVTYDKDAFNKYVDEAFSGIQPHGIEYASIMMCFPFQKVASTQHVADIVFTVDWSR